MSVNKRSVAQLPRSSPFASPNPTIKSDNIAQRAKRKLQYSQLPIRQADKFQSQPQKLSEDARSTGKTKIKLPSSIKKLKVVGSDKKSLSVQKNKRRVGSPISADVDFMSSPIARAIQKRKSISMINLQANCDDEEVRSPDSG